MENRITALFGIRYPIVAGGMVWCSGWRLAAAVSRAGGLGLIGAGSMSAELLLRHIRCCREATDAPFGVNIPLGSRQAAELVETVCRERVAAVFTSAGDPARWTGRLHDAGCRVAHVVSNARFARKCRDAGVDAVVAEGVEAGGHNGRECTATTVLLPSIRREVSLPLIAAGGIASGEGMLAAFALGAEGVQIGTRFALSRESSACEAFKRRCAGAEEGATVLLWRGSGPTRMVYNDYARRLAAARERGASPEELSEISGRGGTRRGIFEGDLEQGELEIGQAATLCNDVPPAGEIVRRIIAEYEARLGALSLGGAW